MLPVPKQSERLVDAEEQCSDALAVRHRLEGQTLLALSVVMDREPVHPVHAGHGVASPAFMGYPSTVI